MSAALQTDPRADILAKLRADTRDLPAALVKMADEALTLCAKRLANDEAWAAYEICARGATRLNKHFARAGAGDKHALDAMAKDQIDAISLSAAADHFQAAADAFDALFQRGIR